MKGIVFTEFIEMVEEKFGLEIADYIIDNSELTSEGSYTAVGTYDFFEMQQLLVHLSEVTKISVNDLIYTYGLYFFKTLTRLHKDIFKYYTSPLAFVASIENHIHVQVKKIYPEAELPSFEIVSKSANELVIIYISQRAMYMFAKALIEKTFEYYHENVEITYELLNEKGTEVKFKIKTYGAIKKS